MLQTNPDPSLAAATPAAWVRSTGTNSDTPLAEIRDGLSEKLREMT